MTDPAESQNTQVGGAVVVKKTPGDRQLWCKWFICFISVLCCSDQVPWVTWLFVHNPFIIL